MYAGRALIEAYMWRERRDVDATRAGLTVFACWASCEATLYLCHDVRATIAQHALTTVCHRCGCVVDGPRRAHMCFVRAERLCFVCYHRARMRSAAVAH